MWRIKVLYHNGEKIFAPYKMLKFLFFHYWEPAFLLEYYDLDVYINHTSYDSFFFGNCIGFYTEENARRYIKLYDEHCELVKKIYDEHCKLVEKPSKIKPQYIYPDEEHDGKRTDED